MVSIRAINLNKFFGDKKALDSVHLDIDYGMFGLLGPNGAGKTTLMRILATLVSPTSGEIKLNGISINEKKKIRDILGYLPQEFSFYPQMTIYETMDYFAILSGIDNSKLRHQKIEELLIKVNLWNEKKVKTKALSGGMKRRLGIAQALIHDPQILIVDEPTAGLDPEERVRFRNLLSDFAINRTVILSTHIVGDIEFACEKIAILNHGKVIYSGKVRGLVEQVRGNVWSLNIEKNQLQIVKEQYKIISYVIENQNVKVRLLSSVKPTENALSVEPNIEDAYMGLVGGLIS